MWGPLFFDGINTGLLIVPGIALYTNVDVVFGEMYSIRCLLHKKKRVVYEKK